MTFVISSNGQSLLLCTHDVFHNTQRCGFGNGKTAILLYTAPPNFNPIMYCSACGSRMKSKGPRIKQINHCLHFGESQTNIAKRLFRFQEKPFCDKICLFSKAAVPHLLPLSPNTNICSYHQNRYPEDIIFGKLLSHADDSDSSGMNRPADAILFQQLRVSFSHWQCRCGCRYDILLKQT